jgi:hypothetical protein
MKSQSEERAVRVYLGFEPRADVSRAILLQSEYSTYVIFNAVRDDSDSYEDTGRAICNFDGCMVTKFGYPNDEAYFSIPRTSGLGYAVCEVMGSRWKDEIAELNEYSFPGSGQLFADLRHFLILFHDSSFECLANSISSELSNEPLAAILSRLSERLAAE